jgi:hypothetical protein
MENQLEFIFPQVVLHNFGIEFNQKIAGDVFNKLRARNIGLADVFIIINTYIPQCVCSLAEPGHYNLA